MIEVLAISIAAKGFAATFPIAPDARRYVRSAPSSNELEVVSVTTGAVEKRLVGSRFPPYTILFSPDGKTVAECSLFGEVCLWSVDSGKMLIQVADADATAGFTIPLAIRFSPDGHALAIGNLRSTPRSRTGEVETARLSLWEVKGGKRIFESALPLGGEIRKIRFAHGGKIVRVATSSVTDLDAQSGRVGGPKKVMLAQDLSEDGRLAFSGTPGWIHVSETDTGRILLHQRDPRPSSIQRVRFAPDDRSFVVSRHRLITSGDIGYTVTSFEMWRLRDGIRLWSSGEMGFVGSGFCFSPDGQKILLPNGELRDVDTGRVDARIENVSKVFLDAKGTPVLVGSYGTSDAVSKELWESLDMSGEVRPGRSTGVDVRDAGWTV